MICIKLSKQSSIRCVEAGFYFFSKQYSLSTNNKIFLNAVFLTSVNQEALAFLSFLPI